MIKTIIFDLGGVYFTDGTQRAINIISEKYKLDKNIVADVFKGEIGTKYRKSQISNDEFWNLAKQVLELLRKMKNLMKFGCPDMFLLKGQFKQFKI